MAEPINFNRARKTRAKADAKAQAAENRVRFGRPKAERDRAALEADRAAKALDDKKREP
jgi:hypothetical protein